jgi:alkanesulfonate monooxygenase SsuD/methylene tetrahydromethanopterin reductase-like flavin-dependent oxidoreductase (luciferase family)
MMRIDIAGWTREAMAGDHQTFRAIFESADRWGFDGAWFSEFRVPQSDWQYPSPLLLASALLARTERLRVGTAVLVLPLHHPLMLAEEIAQLDFQSGGRIDVGIGRGTEPASLASLEIDPASTRERFERGARILRAALRGDSVASSGGPWNFAARRLASLPLQRPHPPIYVAGSTEETLAFALAEDLPLLLSLEPPESAQLERLERAAQQQGRDARALLARSSLARYVCIGANAAQVQRQLDGLWEKLHARRVHFAGKRGVAAADVPPVDRPRVLREQFIHGTPEQCHAQILALGERLGLRSLRCIFNANGLWSNDAALAAMQLFAQEVLPALHQPEPVNA